MYIISRILGWGVVRGVGFEADIDICDGFYSDVGDDVDIGDGVKLN